MDNVKYGKIVDFVHLLVRESYSGRENLMLIDATAGNGFDALFLCKVAKETGHVAAFDIQAQAIERTTTLLKSNLDYVNYEIINDSHENICNYVTEKIDAVLFNLGYLPFSDKEVTTKSDATLNAVKNLLPMMNTDGRIYITTYVTHDNGKEIKEIYEFVSNLNKREYNVINIKIINKDNAPPQIFIIEKNA